MPLSQYYTKKAAQVIQRFLQLHNMPAGLTQEPIEGEALKTAASILQDFQLDPEAMLDSSHATLYRAFKKESIEVGYIDRLAVIFHILDKGIQAFESEEDFRNWLVSRVPTLGNARPVDLLPYETGRREVEKAIDRVEYNLYG